MDAAEWIRWFNVRRERIQLARTISNLVEEHGIEDVTMALLLKTHLMDVEARALAAQALEEKGE